MSPATAALLVTAALAGWTPAAQPVRPAVLPDSLAILALPPALPGAVITAAVPVPAALRQQGAVRYTIALAPTVRLFAPAEGVVEADAPDRLPLTFTLPRDQAAGPLRIARVQFVGKSGAAYATELVVNIVARRHIRMRVAAADVATSSRPLVVHYRVANAGNAVDTVELRVQVPPGWRTSAGRVRQAVPRGDTLEASCTVEIPRDVPPGAYSVTITAAGRADTTVANASFSVGQDGGVGGWRTIPATLFVGLPAIASGPARATVALSAFGTPAPGTSVVLQLRHSAPVQSLAFNRYAAGPEALLQINRPDWRLAAGDLFVTSGAVPGVYAMGVGGEYSWSGHTVGELELARPREFGSALLPGHLLRGSFGVPTPLGLFGVRGSDFQRPLREGLASNRTQSGSLLYDLGPSTSHLQLEGGYARVQADTAGSREGPAFRGEYTLSGGGAYVSARLTQIPAVAPGDAGMNERALAAAVPLVHGIQLLGFGASTTIPFIGLPETRHDAASAGLRASHGGASLDLRANYTETGGLPLLLGGGWRERTLSARGVVVAGPLTLDVLGERGTIQNQAGGERPLWNARGNLAWRGPTAAAWLGIDRSETQFGAVPLRLDLGGFARVHELQLDAGAAAFMSPQQGTYLGHVWGAAGIPLLHGTAAVLGAEYQPWMPEKERTRFSVGLKAQLGLPVLVPGRAAARGVVFEDRNADGRWEEGEPFMPGVGLHLGSYATSTDPRGRFAFPAIGGLRTRPELQVDLTSLPVGWMVGEHAPAGRNAAVPLVRAGSMRIQLVSEERFGRDSTARPAPKLPIDLVDADGRQRSAVSDSTGTVLFRALPPGRYTLTVYPVGARGQVLPIKVIPLELGSGADRTVVVPVPTLPVEIRFRTPPVQGPLIIKGRH